MSIWEYLKRRIIPVPPPSPKPTPVTPPPAPPIDPVYANKRAEAMRRRASDSLKYKKYQSEALSTGFLPPVPPSIDWYMNHPEYAWNPYEPNPERPEPPKPDFPKPKPIPQPSPSDVESALSASKRWREDMDKWRQLSGGITNRNKPKSQPPSVTYYQKNPDYKWNPNDPQVR